VKNQTQENRREFQVLDKIRKLYVNGTVNWKFLAALKLYKILGNICFSEQIFYGKQSLVPLTQGLFML